MAWAEKSEHEWDLLITKLSHSENGFFVILYDRQFTFDALIRRLESTFKSQGWMLLSTVLAKRLYEFLASNVIDSKIKAVTIKVDKFTELNKDLNQNDNFRALNLSREKLFSLPTNLIFILQNETFPKLLVNAPDFATWINLPYQFELPQTSIPDLPPIPQDVSGTTSQIDYYRDLIGEAIFNDREKTAYKYIPLVADLYLDAGKFDIAQNLFQVLCDHHELTDIKKPQYYENKLIVAKGWKILDRLNAGRITLDEQNKIKELINDKVFFVQKEGNQLTIVDSFGRSQSYSVELFLRLGLLAEEVKSDIQSQALQGDPSLLLVDAEQTYTFTAMRYGMGYANLSVSLSIRDNGSAQVKRTVRVEAYSSLDGLDVSLINPEKTEHNQKQTPIGLETIRSLNANWTIPKSKIQRQENFGHFWANFSISPQLQYGDVFDFETIENAPAGLYAVSLTHEELSKRKTSFDYFGWSIDRPTRYLSLHVEFPEGMRPYDIKTQVMYAAVGGIPAKRFQVEEQKRLTYPTIEKIDKHYYLTMDVAYPMIGLVYIIGWNPLEIS